MNRKLATRALLATTTVAGMIGVAAVAAPAAQAEPRAKAPVINISAPAQVKVGKTFKLNCHARGLNGKTASVEEENARFDAERTITRRNCTMRVETELRGWHRFRVCAQDSDFSAVCSKWIRIRVR